MAVTALPSLPNQLVTDFFIPFSQPPAVQVKGTENAASFAKGDFSIVAAGQRRQGAYQSDSSLA